MKKFRVVFAVLLLIGAIGFTDCKKKKTETEEAPATPPPVTVTEGGQNAYDNWKIMTEIDCATSDINQVISDQPLLHGKNSTGNPNSVFGNICGMTVDTNGMYLGTVQLNYNGTICSNRNRTGSIKITIQNYSTGVKWKNINAVVKVDYLNYKALTVSNNKSIQLNGTAYLTNQSGGTWFDLFFLGQPSLVHLVTANSMSVIINNTIIASYNVNRQTTYTLPSSILTSVNKGMANYSGYTNLESYGTISSDSLFCKVNNDVIWNWTCGAWAPVAGNVTVKVKGKTYDLNTIFAVDAIGTPVVPTPSTCAYGFKVNWTIGSITTNSVFGYL